MEKITATQAIKAIKVPSGMKGVATTCGGKIFAVACANWEDESLFFYIWKNGEWVKSDYENKWLLQHNPMQSALCNVMADAAHRDEIEDDDFDNITKDIYI